MVTALYLFTRDLRLDDNPGLYLASNFDRLHLMTVVENQWFRPGRYQFAAMGEKRWSFLKSGLENLSTSLEQLGQTLDIRYGDLVEEVVTAVSAIDADRLILARPIGLYETRQLERIKTLLPNLQVMLTDSSTLFQIGQADWLTAGLPKQYTPFRRLAEKLSPPLPLEAPEVLPASPLRINPEHNRPNWLPTVSTPLIVSGGETPGQQHLKSYLQSEAPQSYKITRNSLEGWDKSSKFSLWLGLGFLSPRRIWQRLKAYEETSGANESTEWLFVELLWREYFQWLALNIGARLFTFKGLAKRRPLISHYSHRLAAWCNGATGYDIVDACMRELAATGYLSNRGRQIVASALVNELQVDWRYGAAWFENQLIDYDVASNWGNWQYIAGVGVDPRGGRHFNLEKQREQFDTDGHYVSRWLGEERPFTKPLIDVVDAADWPIA